MIKILLASWMCGTVLSPGFCIAIDLVPATRTEVNVRWLPTTPYDMSRACGNPNASGCSWIENKDGKTTCVIAAPVPPVTEFSPYHDTMTHVRWRIMAHELMHCFGWEHQKAR